MKSVTKTIALFVLLVCTSDLFSQNTAFEVHIIDDSLSILPSKFLNERNSGYIGLVKKAPLYSRSLSNYTCYLYRIDDNGDTTSYRFAKNDTILVYYDFIRIDLGEPGYILSGLAETSENPGDVLTVFTRLDTSLNIIWEKIFRFDFFYSGWEMRMMQLKDSSFIYCCTPRIIDDLFLLTLSYDGDSLKYKTYSQGADSSGSIQSITYNPDSSVVWLHNNWAHYSGEGSALNSCIVIDSQLKQTAVYHYPEDYTDLPFTSKLLPDGNLITAGTSWFTPGGEISETYISAYKLDTAFNVLNEIHLTDPDTNSRGGEKVAIDYFYPSCIYVAGSHNAQDINGSSPSWFYIAKLDDTLGLDFEKYIGGDDYYMLFSVTATKDGGVLLAGTRAEVYGLPFHRDGYIIKLDSTGCITGISGASGIRIKEVLIYPNPGSKKLMVRTAMNDCRIHLFNMKGKVVLVEPIDKHITEIDVRKLKSGTYIFLIEQNNKSIETGQWIKQ